MPTLICINSQCSSHTNSRSQSSTGCRSPIYGAQMSLCPKFREGRDIPGLTSGRFPSKSKVSYTCPQCRKLNRRTVLQPSGRGFYCPHHGVIPASEVFDHDD